MPLTLSLLHPLLTQQKVILYAGKVIKSGDRFGSWTVLNKSNVRLGEHNYYYCKCECGVKNHVRSDSLRSGRSQSCGCKNQTPVAEYFGMSFGQWMVISEGKRNKCGRRMMYCQCSCGCKREVELRQLQIGRSKSCGHKKCQKRGLQCISEN